MQILPICDRFCLTVIDFLISLTKQNCDIITVKLYFQHIFSNLAKQTNMSLNPYQFYNSPNEYSWPVQKYQPLQPYDAANFSFQRGAINQSFNKNPLPIANQIPVNQSHNQQRNRQPPAVDNSFIDRFRSSRQVNSLKSHAHNYKRLFNIDQKSEDAKEQRKKVYRQQLQEQIRLVNERKKAEKQKIEAEELERERKFYEGFKIEATQGKQGGQAEQNNQQSPHFLMRTLHKPKPAKHFQNQALAEETTDHKLSRKAYKNRSVMDNPEIYEPNFHNRSREEDLPRQARQKQISSIEKDITQQRNIQEQRIAKIFMFQDEMLKKLSAIREEIHRTTSVIDTSKELEQIRSSLHAANANKYMSNFEESTVNPVENMFYSLPKKNSRPVANSIKRQSARINRIKQKQFAALDYGKERVVESRVVHRHKNVNDKNIIDEKDEDGSIQEDERLQEDEQAA